MADKPQVTWDIADVDNASLTQRMAGVLDYMPEPEPTLAVSYPGVESEENQAYPGDSPAMKPWTYIDSPIRVHPLLPGKPGGDINPYMTLYLHARITADGKLQLAVFAEKGKADTMMLTWDAADVSGNGGSADQLSWEGDKSPDLTIADADAVEGVLVHGGRLNTKHDPKLIGPLAPCARVNIWDSCGGGGPVVTYGHLHSLWGCIVDNVLYMHVFYHEVSQMGEYVVLAAGGKFGPGCDYTCSCKRVKVELPPVLYNMCPTVLDCPPEELDPDPYDIYEILGFKQNLCCGADIIANARRLALEVIGVEDYGTSLLMERDIAELDDARTSGGCGIVQHHKGDISAEYTLLTKHGGLYNGEWVVTQRDGVCASPVGNTFGQWSDKDGFPYGREADHGNWAEPGLQSFGGFEWPSQEDREEDGSFAQCAFIYSMSGRAHIDLLRYGRILEANTEHSIGGAPSTTDVYVTVQCCEGCAGCESCPGGTMMGSVDFGTSGPARYVRIELAAHLCKYMYDTASESLDREIIAEMTWGRGENVSIAAAVRELIEGSSVLGQLIGVRSASGSSLSLYLLRKDNNSIDTCTMDIEYKVGDSQSATKRVQFTECISKPSRALTGPATPMAARAVTAMASSGQAPYVPMYDFRYKVSVYNGTEVSSVSGAAADMQDMAADATRALQDGLSIVASDDGLLTVRSASGERTVVVNLYSGDDGTTPIQTVTVFVEK